MLKSYRELEVWQVGMDLAAACYECSRRLPREELFGLTSQIRRAAASVPANIAEGYGRGSRRDYTRFLEIARGSIKELETHLLLAERVCLLSAEEVRAPLAFADRVGRMLHVLIQRLRQSQKPEQEA